MKLEIKAKNHYDEFLSKYFINGEFVFKDSQLDYDFKSKEFNEILELFCTLSNQGYLAADALIKASKILFGYLYNQIIECEFDYEQNIIELLKNLDLNEDELIRLFASAHHYGYSNELDYQIDEEAEIQFIWKY